MLTKNALLFKFYYFFWRFKPLAALTIVYFAQITQSYTMATAVFAVFNISYALAKIPSGLISDRIGRKPVIIMANIFTSMAFFLLAFAGQFEIKWFLFAYAFLWGCGEALCVGTIEALMYETTESLGQTDKFYQVYSKSMYFDQFGCAFGAFWAMVITYFLPLQFVAWLSVLPPCVQLFVSFFFVEPEIKKKSVSFSFKDMLLAFSQFKQNKKLLLYSFADIYFSTLGDISHRFESAYFKLFAGDWIINLARMFKHFCGMLGAYCVSYFKKFAGAEIYFTSIASNVFIRTVALSLNNACTPFVHMFINFFYATASVAKTDILQHEFLPEYRATAQSFLQFIKGLYMAGLMLLLGFFADFAGIYPTMILLVILRIIGLLILYILRKMHAVSF